MLLRNKSEPPAQAKAAKGSTSHPQPLPDSAATSKKPTANMLILASEPSEPMQLDGRASRTLKRCQGKIEEMEKSLKEIKLDDVVQSAQATASKEYKAHCAKRIAVVNAAVKEANGTIKAVEKSTHKDAFQTQLCELEALVALGQNISRLIAFMPQPRPDPEDFLKQLDQFKTLNNLELGLGPGFTMKSLMARANEACLHRKYDDFTAFLMASSEEASILAQNIAETDLRAHITTEVENRLLSAMRAITAEELALKAQGKASEEEAPNLFEATSLAKSVVLASLQPDFLAGGLAEIAGVAYHLLEQHDIAELQRHSAKVTSLASEKAEKLDGMTRFFLQHEVGKALLGMCCERVQHGELEGEYQALGQVAEKAISSLEAHGAEEGQQGRSQGIEVISNAISPAADALQSLQQCAFVKSKQAKKPLSDGTLPSDILSILEKRFSNAAVAIVVPDLNCTVREHLLPS